MREKRKKKEKRKKTKKGIQKTHEISVKTADRREYNEDRKE